MAVRIVRAKWSFSVAREPGTVIRGVGIGFLMAIFTVLLMGQGTEGVVATDPTPRAREWERPLVGAWKRRPLREITEKIDEALGVSIVLDRRIDPDQQIDFSAEGKSVDEEIQRLAEGLGAGASICGGMAYVGPEPGARSLQTLIALRKEELIPRRRSPVGTWMFQTGDFGWKDLEKPREIVQRWLSAAGMTVTNPELIRDDRWGGADLHGLTPIEALSVVLVQWDLTFSVNPSRKELTLKPIPGEVSVSRVLGILKGDAEERKRLLGKLKQEFSHVELEVSGQRVKGRGRWEELQRVQEKLSGRKTVPVEEVVPLRERSFTLRLRDVSLRQVMEEFEKSGVEFVYDKTMFEEQKIDLESKPELDVKEMPAGELFEKLFSPLGVSVELEGVRVLLRVKGK